METFNTFTKGMNEDLSKFIPNPNSYLQALNFRPQTELGSSNGSLVNIKGNECKITFPDLQPVYKLQVIKGNVVGIQNNMTLTINGVTHTKPINSSTLGLDLYNFIIKNFQNCYSYAGNTVTVKTFDVAYDEDFIVIYNQPVYQNCTPINSVSPVITISYFYISPATTVLNFIGVNSSSLTQNLVDPYIKGILSSNIVTIGSTFILNDIYLLTAPNDLNYGIGLVEEPINDSLSNVGAIWKLNIDDITKQHTITLIYSNNLDFTKFHPVPPSAITGRYESIDIKRIYWSDNYNKIRTINTAQSQLMALNPSQLSVTPKIEFTQPTLKSIGSGSLIAGSYQMAYRLSKVLGNITNYSECSSPVYLTQNPEITLFQDYEGGVGNSSKSITWNLNNVDITYDQIEPIVIYRNSASSLGVITSMGVRPVSETMDITYSNSAATGYLNVSLEEFLLFKNTFTHAKTVDTKDNRLFWGNVRAPHKSIDSFDTRAYRANNAGNILLTNNGVSQIHTPVTVVNLNEDADCINEYYDFNGNYSSNACYLKPSTALNPSPILGGEGPNISYEFGTKSILSDTRHNIDGSANFDITGFSLPFRDNTTDSSTITLTDYNYPQNSKYFSLKQPEKTSLLVGYQHEEIYRFGIQIFDKQSNPFFTKWIGDIKMPSYGDYNNNCEAFATEGISDFRLSFVATGGNTQQYSQILYIKFTINLPPTIQNLVGGYQIVRIKREGNDKTIWGVGMINPFSPNDLTNPTNAVLPASWDTKLSLFANPLVPLVPASFARYYSVYPNQMSAETLNDGNDTSSSELKRFKMFDCWDMDIGIRPNYSAGDKILIREKLECVNYDKNNSSYRAFFGTKGNNGVGAAIPPDDARIDDGSYGTNKPGPFVISSNNDSGPLEPFFIMKMNSFFQFCDYTDFINTLANPYDFVITEAKYIPFGASLTSIGGYGIKNYGEDVYSTNYPAWPKTGKPSEGKQTLYLDIAGGLPTTDFGCYPTDNRFKKLLGLYYKPNPLLYGGATYVARSNNEYIPCGEYISTVVNNINKNQNLTFVNYGGDVFTVIYDMMKTVKGPGSKYTVFERFDSSPYLPKGLRERQAKFSTSFYFACTSVYNPEVRLGNHPNRSIISSSDAGYGEDNYTYETYNNAENDIKKYFPKPLNFQTADEWINRIYFSEKKFNNELFDSWSEYLSDSYYDVEGNYGPINTLITLKENIYYIQERGIGILMINPLSIVNDSAGQPITLGSSSEVIQKHYYKAIDVGTSHQWSVYRSQSLIAFIDVRHKKIYLFDGESVTSISDTKGQRSFIIKRLHNELLKFDNPVIDKGVLTTYDYYHNEFLFSFLNVKDVGVSQTDERLTLVYSEVLSTFTGIYSFAPNLYINSNKYLISTNRNNKLWFHNYGIYGSFYNTVYPCIIKIIINDRPELTKVFNNLVWNSESINDNIEWNDDFNLYPGSSTVPNYPDNVNHQTDTFTKVRCYNDHQNTDWTNLTLLSNNNNLTRKERNFNLQIPRNKFDYDSNLPSTISLFDPSKLTKTTFGEKLRDKYLIVELHYPNTLNNRFILNNTKTIYELSSR